MRSLAWFGVATLVACGIDQVGLGSPDASMPLDASRDVTVLPDASGDAGGVDASTDVAAEAQVMCPTGLAGPTLVPVEDYCVDSTEVTTAQYALFVAANGPFIPDAGARCSWVNTLVPKNIMLDPAVPQVYIDWCEAHMYCQWAKKRLCGARAGGQLPNSTPVASPTDAWWYACSQGGLRKYAYGSYWDAGACNSDGVNGQTTAVATHPGCVGGYPGLYDMTGNVKEWIASCDNDNGNNDNCRLLGGAYNDNPSNSACDSTVTQHRDHNSDDNIGFRCCWP